MRKLPKASIRRKGKTAAVPPLECAGALLEGLPQVVWFIRRHMRRHRGHGLTVPQFRTLVLLSKYPSASLSDVADHLGTTLPSVSRMVGGLVSKGVIARESAVGDRRRLALVCTRRGEALLAGAQAETRRRLADELDKLTDAERAVICEAVNLLHQSFAHVAAPGEEVDDDRPAPVAPQAGKTRAAHEKTL